MCQSRVSTCRERGGERGGVASPWGDVASPRAAQLACCDVRRPFKRLSRQSAPRRLARCEPGRQVAPACTFPADGSPTCDLTDEQVLGGIVIRPILIGAVAGMRSMLPLAAISYAARRRRLPRGHALSRLLGKPLTGNSLLALAAGELLGDKWSAAPDRISAAGLAARLTTGALAGAALAAPDERRSAAVLGAAAAVMAGYVSFAVRVRAMNRFGRVPAGLAEDALALGAALYLSSGRK